MNNDKAIALLRRMQEPEAYEPQITAEAFEALGMAIKALEQASFPRRHENDHIADGGKMDCICRQAAIDVLNDGAELLRRVLDDMDVVGVEREKYEWGLGLIESYISDMEELPSAEPKRKRAYLINPNPYGECSECGQLIDSRDGFNFCPNCGSYLLREGDMNG